MSQMVRLERCEICLGTGRIRGIFHVMSCAACNGGGLVNLDGTSLRYPELVEQLRARLDRSDQLTKVLQHALEVAGLWPLRGPANDYLGNNKKGAGGAHFTGD
jgi:hypothetical protein